MNDETTRIVVIFKVFQQAVVMSAINLYEQIYILKVVLHYFEETGLGCNETANTL